MSDDSHSPTSHEHHSTENPSAEHRNRPRQPRPKSSSLFSGCLILIVMGSMGANFFLLLMLIATSSSFSPDANAIEEKFHSHNQYASDKVAILSIEGLIANDKFVKKQIERIEEDDSVKAIVLRVDSPGGTISGSDYIHHHLTKLLEKRKIPMVVSMGMIAASGGYYVSMPAGEQNEENIIFAEPTTWTGSIGVIIPHYNASKLASDYGVQEDSIKSHRLKGMGSMFHEMTMEEKAIFQGLVDEAFERFKEIIRKGRPKLTDETLTEVATGQVFTADQALKFGLIDKIGFQEEAIDHVIQLANLDKDNVAVIEYKKPIDLFGNLLLGQAKQDHTLLKLEALFNLSTPKAYYLCSWIPGLSVSQ